MAGSVDVTLVDACLRDGAGGSPTAVVSPGDDPGDDPGDAALARIPARAGTSHVAVIGRDRTLRFFTSAGELPSCGHGTVAAITVLAGTAGFAGRLRSGGRDFTASGGPGPTVGAWFDQGVVALQPAGTGLVGAFLAAIGLTAQDLHPGYEPAVASPGRPRLLLPVASRSILTALRPDHDRLAAESRRHGQLGCFAYTPTGPARAAARMFAPAIGVPEDVANANSTGGLAAHLLAAGHDPAVAVDQGDALGRPSTVRATAAPTGHGITTRVGGTARTVGTFRFRLEPRL